MLQEHFHPIAGVPTEERMAKNIRQFVGDGTPLLKVPGLKEVTSVRVGSADIPLSIEERVPTDPDAKLHQTVEVALIKLDKLEDGTPVLMRSVKSNNGMWQNGVAVYVGGKWSGDKEPTAPPVDNDTAKAKAEAAKQQAKADAEADAKAKAEAEAEAAKAKAGTGP